MARQRRVRNPFSVNQSKNYVPPFAAGQAEKTGTTRSLQVGVSVKGDSVKMILGVSVNQS
jgi:hypothetical protein